MKGKSLFIVTLLLSFNSYGLVPFGFSGQRGYDGRDGQNGTQGANATLFAQEGARQLLLAGTDGYPGGDGQYGGNATGCYQQLEHHDMIGASGGDGGNGGDGGRGGDGGDAIIYFGDQSQLRQIFIDAQGGRGSQAGRGAYGGMNCQCQYPYWTHTYSETRYRDEQYQECTTRRICRPDGDQGREVCRDERVCETRTRRVPYTHTWQRTYTCRDGQLGQHGRTGQQGANGSPGQLTLIKSDDILGPVRPHLTLSLASMEGDYQLSDHRFSTHRGASSLLAAGSRVSDVYRQWDGMALHHAHLVWSVPGKDPADFGDGQLHLALQGDQLSYDFPEEFLHTKKVERQGDHTTINITQALLRADVERMRVSNVAGTLKNAYVEVVDDAQVSDLVSTRFYIKAKWRKASDRKFYAQWVPSEFVSRDGDRFRINIGEFDLKARRFLFFKRKEYFKRGAKVKFELTIERSFGGKVIELKPIRIAKKI